MDETTKTLLNRIDTAVDHLMDLEGQDPMLVIEMFQAMLGDVLDRGGLKPMADYVGRYCDVIDGPDEAREIARKILAVSF